MMVFGADEIFTVIADVSASLFVCCKVRFKSVVLLEEPLDGCHGVAIILDSEKLLLLTEIMMNFVNVLKKSLYP